MSGDKERDILAIFLLLLYGCDQRKGNAEESDFFGCCKLVGYIVDSNVNGNINTSLVHYADYK
jgi:hypothetical protein